VVIEDVPPETTVVGNPGHPVRVEGRPVEGPDTDWIHLPDPIQEAIKELSDRIAKLEKRLGDASEGGDGTAEVTELRPKKGPSSAGG
jgi:serine O-acetyltransferase